MREKAYRLSVGMEPPTVNSLETDLAARWGGLEVVDHYAGRPTVALARGTRVTPHGLLSSGGERE
ncbi:MAG: hypothetical protein PVI07_18240 [Anaerolineae bacterium]